MAAPYDGAVVVVTGASSGIGLELARQMAPRAKAIALVARREERLDALAKELRERYPSCRVLVHKADLCDLDQAAAMIDAVEAELGPIDVLVNNAGFGDVGVFDLADWDKLARMIQLNVTALTFLTHRVLPGMYARRKGGVLNVSSGFGLQWMPAFAAYVGTKHYVTSFTESLRVEAALHGVTVTQVCPGPVDTEFEQVAENPTGHSPPSFVRISAERCAREALRGFERGRAIVVPGVVMKLVLASGAVTPRWFLRLLYRPVARWMRERELAAR
ncbi:MAG TPA: SDR family oxidoreductase [Sandaracinaceae bacterium]